MIKTGIIGVKGYAGEELVDVLLGHSEVKIASLSARVDSETAFSSFNPKFAKRTALSLKSLTAEEVARKADVVFLALPHTVSMEVAGKVLAKGKKVIDLSADYRLEADVYEKWYGHKHLDPANIMNAVYGLPEINRAKIKKASLIANPGCYPTSVILGLLPIAEKIAEKKIAVIVDSKSGTTGAGRKTEVSLLFGEVDGNFKCYKPNNHQHMPEMEAVLSLAAGGNIKITFVPHLLPVRRGILSTIYVDAKNLPGEDDLYAIYEKKFKDESFVRLLPKGSMPELQQVVGTNFCDIGIKVAGGMLIIVSVIDNLLKGAAGQAVQNMNIMFGLDERAGLL